MLVAAAAARLRSTRSLPRARPLTMGRRSRAARNRVLTPREVVTLQRTPGGVPEVARCHPEEYDAQLRAKVQQLETQLASAVGAHQTALPPAEVFESARTHFRMRASFAMWREGRDPTTLHYVMYERGDSKTPHEVTSFPMGSRRINELMTPLRDGLAAELVLHERIGDARFLTTTTGDALVALTYNVPLDGARGDAWVAAATELAARLGIQIVGRSRGIKLVVGGETVTEVLQVEGRGACTYAQLEGAFTQPNAKVCEAMLTWAHGATAALGAAGDGGHDLCELYCGNGCFTIALAPTFRRVLATELSKASVDLAERNLATNGVDNVAVGRLSAEEFVEAHTGGRRFHRLDSKGIDVGSYDMRTLFVDPPRAGLDATCRELAATFDHVVYVSCNPETLARDLAELSATHEVTRLAAFDQFPYTPHLESGVVLVRRD